MSKKKYGGHTFVNSWNSDKSKKIFTTTSLWLGTQRYLEQQECVLQDICTRELSRHIWFVLDLGVRVIGKVISEQFRPTPLLQGGLEIPVEIKVEWENKTALHILKEKVSSLNVQEVYKDDSKEIERNFSRRSRC